MIQLMIVDDEERARTGMCQLIDWDDHGISIAALACDGDEALEILKTTPIDILLTDIQMPVMDGLELIERVVATYPHIRCVIMSGYDKFSYARKALALGAKDYLLKPSRRKEILDTVLQLVADIEQERSERENLEHLTNGFRESLPLLKEKTLSKLVLVHHQADRRLEANLRLNDIQFPHPFFGILVFQIDNPHELRQRFKSEDVEWYKYALKNIAEETVRRSYICAAFEHEENSVLIVNTPQSIGFGELTPIANEVQRNVRHYMKFTVSAGIGSFAPSIAHLRVSYSEAAAALHARYFVGDGKVVGVMDDGVDGAGHVSYPLEQEKAILQAITSGDREEAAVRLDDFHNGLKSETASKDQVLRSTFSLLFALNRYCAEKNLNTNDIFESGLIELTRVLANSSMAYIRQALHETVDKMCKEINSKKNGNKMFEAVLAFIHENYRKDISRETVAGEVYVTPGHVSFLFRQNLKTNFVEYLHKVRIEHAYGLLRNKGLRISDIAHDVGYQDEKYFFQVFKKYTGITPNQYRNQIQDNE